ncbi:MAG: YfhO family protein [Lachnospiraceae bacterium]|nr:YfhO family protein [Lachnospiraceae bacterium]
MSGRKASYEYRPGEPDVHPAFFCYTLYTLVFLLLSAAVYSPFFFEGKTLIITGDSIWQHYPAFVYEGRLIRSFLNTLLREGKFVFPMWDFSIGFGADIATSLHYYGFADPLTWLFALLPESLSPFSFSALFILKTYLAGLALLFYVRHHGFERVQAVLSACIYVFSMFVFLFVLRELSFGNVLIYLPLMLLGTDRILEGKSPVLLTLSVFGLGLSNFYFLYQAGLLTAGYLVFRLLFEKRRGNAGEILKLCLRFLSAALIGGLLSAPVLLPVITQITASPRLSFKPYIPLLYHWKYYISFAAAFTGPSAASETLAMGYTPVAFLALLRLFTLGREMRKWKIAFLILLAALFIPACGALMNGCSYPSNRWGYAFGLFISVLTGKMLPYFSNLEKKEKICLLSGSLVYALLCLSLPGLRKGAVIGPVVLLLLSTAVLFLKDKISLFKRTLPAMFGLIVAGIIINACFEFSPVGEHSARERGISAGEALTRNVWEEADGALKEDKDFFRVSDEALSPDLNSRLLRGGNGLTLYLSITSPFVPDYMGAMYVSNSRTFSWKGLDSRFLLEELARVKYAYAGENKERFGYSTFKTRIEGKDGETFDLLKMNDPLPFGTVYHNAMNEEAFFALPPEARQEALLSDAVLEELPSGFAPSNEEIRALDISEERGEYEHVELRDGKYIVTVPEASFTVKLKDAGPGEYYAVFSGMNYEPLPAGETREWREASKPEKVLLLLKSFFEDKEESIRIKAECADTKTQFSYLPEWNEYFCNRRNFILPLGRFSSAPEELKIIFPYKGIYTFDALYAAAEPYDGLEEKINALSVPGMENAGFGVNTINGKAELDRPGILMLGAPYSPGWRARVDGKEEKIRKGNLMESALVLPEGEHEIILQYETPGLKAGLVLLCLGILAVLAGIVLRRAGCFQRRK